MLAHHRITMAASFNATSPSRPLLRDPDESATLTHGSASALAGGTEFTRSR
jgi:hypothetical protein